MKKQENMEKYVESFKNGLMIDESVIVEELEYQSIDEWDSVGHMELIAELEETFDIALDADDIINFSSFKVGIDILKKYGVEI